MASGQGTVVSATVRSHRDLLVWQKAMDLVDRVYDLAEGFPVREGFGLTSQITRAVVSVPSNIAEGQARSTSRDFANFLAIARGSLMETETLLTVAVRGGVRFRSGSGIGVLTSNRNQQDAHLAAAPDRGEGTKSVILLSTIHCPLCTRGEVPWWRR